MARGKPISTKKTARSVTRPYLKARKLSATTHSLRSAQKRTSQRTSKTTKNTSRKSNRVASKNLLQNVTKLRLKSRDLGSKMAVFSQQSSVSVVKQITKYSNLVASTFDQIDAWFAVRETELTTSVSQGFYQLKKAIAKKSATVKSPALLKSFKLPSLPQWPKAKATPAKKTTKKQSEKTITITQTSGTLFTQKSRWHKWWPTLREKISSTRSQVRAEINELFNIQPDVSNSSSKSPRRKRRGLRHFKAYLKTIRLSFKPYAIVFRKFPWQTFLSLLVTGFILGGAYGLFTYVFQDLPDPKELSKQEQVLTTKILDRNGQLLFRIYKDENRTLIPLSRLPQHLINATIAIEDKNFYNHHGFSVKGITRAMLANIEGEEYEQGGSTITQQLVKNRLLTPEKTIRRKIREIVLSVLVDGTYTKEEILEMYFNEVAYGGSTYGIEEAAQRYFGKSASQLTLAESALLAGLPQAPSVYSPYGPNPEASYARQEEVLRRMVEDQYITQEQADQAKQEILQFKPDTVDIQAPHFVMYVKQMLAEQYGEELLQEGGLEVRTTLDLELQKQVQKLVTDELNKLARLRINNGAALVTNPQTGEILAMVGSKNYFDFEHDGQVNVVLRPRQPGSSIKPLTYAVAFERGKNPSSVEDDAPITYHIPGSKPYSPKNYDGKFHGRVTLREALGSSYNIPAVKLLAQSGINTVIDKGQEMGITTWQDRQRFGLSLTLGGGEVLMLDLAKVYGTFANQGYTTDINPIMEVKNSKGETLYTNDCAIAQEGCPKRKTLDTRVAYQITDVLKDNNARIPAFGARSVLHIPGQEVAVKTGTTNNLRDNWTFGYTTDRLVAVWVGNNDNTSMSYVASGVTGASPIWNYIMRLLLDDKNPHTFGTPEGLIKVQICARTGTLPCRGCPAVRDEYFTPGTQPTQACNPAQFAPRPKASPQPTDANRDQILQGQSI